MAYRTPANIVVYEIPVYPNIIPYSNGTDRVPPE